MRVIASARIVEAQGAQPLGQFCGAYQLVGAVVDVELLLGREARVADDGQDGVPQLAEHSWTVYMSCYIRSSPAGSGAEAWARHPRD
jgi:hypothetical protein